MKFTIKVKAGVKAEYIRSTGGQLEVGVTEQADKGKANRAVIRALAEQHGVPTSRVRIVAGHASRVKIVEVI